MALNAKNLPGGGNLERPDPLDPGTYPARVVLITTLGTQLQRPYQGEEKPPHLELLVTYELLDEFMKDEDDNDIPDKPRWITETFPFHNLEADRAKSTKRYYALDPKGLADGNWDKLIGTPCMLTIVIKEGQGKNAGKFYENISGVSAMRPREAEKAGPLVNDPVVFDFYAPEKEAFDALPNWIKKKMSEAVDYEGSAVAKMADNAADKVDQPEKKKPKVKAPVVDDVEQDEIPW